VSNLIPTATAKVVLGRGDKAYSNIRIRCGDRDILFDPDQWPSLRDQGDAAYDDAIAVKSQLIEERKKKWKSQ
jgi:hypothetical protein